MTNKDELINTNGESNMILVLGGHCHSSSVNQYPGVNFVQLPPPKSKFTEFTVVRITQDRLTAIHYDFTKKAWLQDRAVRIASQLMTAMTRMPPEI